MDRPMKKLICGDFFPRLILDMKARPGLWASRLVLLLGPWASFWMVEILNGNDVFHDLYAWQVLMNLIWYCLLFIVCRLVLGRNKWACTAGAVLSFAFGLVNHYVLRFRGRILFPADVAGWHTAANVAAGFDYSMDTEMTQAAVLLVAFLFLALVCPRRRGRAKLPRAAAVLLWVLTLGYSFAFFKTDMLPDLGIYTQQWVTQRNGFALNFTVALRYIFNGLDPSEDPTPFLHSLTENTVKGWMYSPVTGGGTASVEFEYLTGFSTLFQPPHTVAYQLYVKEDMPSLAALAGSAGYDTTAFHPYKSSGWNRPIAYQDLDFDHQLYEEDVEDPYLIRHYISDRSDYETVMETTRSANAAGQKCFVFNVTMQNHSGYSQGWNNLERTIDLPDQLKNADSSAIQYLALARASDDALKQLIEYYSQVEEPTMVVLFGDHQPPLKNAFYEELYGKALSERTTEEVMKQYITPFFIWANYDIEEQQNVAISPNYLGVLTAKLAGLPLTGFMEFLDELYQQLPAITPVGILTADGQYLKRDELNEEQQALLEQYSILNYCGMVDLFDEARDMFCVSEG